jgi:hypothetical protein
MMTTIRHICFNLSVTIRRTALAFLVLFVVAGTWIFIARPRVLTSSTSSENTNAFKREPYAAVTLQVWDTSHPGYSPECNAVLGQLQNELVRRPEAWGVDDAEFITSYINLHHELRPNIVWEDGKFTKQEFEMFIMSNAASVLAADRILHGGNITPEAVALIDDAMIVMLGSTIGNVRNEAVAATCDAGLWHYRKDVLTTIRRMQSSDPDALVRANIESRMKRFDQLWRHAHQNWEYVRGPRS